MQNASGEDLGMVRARALSAARSAEEMLRDSIHALKTRDDTLAERVRSGRPALLQEMDAINEEIYAFIAMNQPLMQEMQQLACIARMTSSMEQVSRNAGEIALVATGYPQRQVIDRMFAACSIPDMADRTLSMVHDTLLAFGSPSPDPVSRHAARNAEIQAMGEGAIRVGLSKVAGDPRDISAMEQAFTIIRALQSSALYSFIAAERISVSMTGRALGGD